MEHFFIEGQSNKKKVILWHKINILCIFFASLQEKKKKRERVFMRAINLLLFISGCCIRLCSVPSIRVLELCGSTQTEAADYFSAQL